MAQLSVDCPLNESNLHYNLRLNPVSAQSWQSFRAGERRFFNLQFVESRPQAQQQFSVKAGADLSGKDKIAAVVITDQPCAQPHALSLRIREAADGKLLGQPAFHLQP